MVTEIELKYSLLESQDSTNTQQVQFIISQLLSEHELAFIHHKKQLSNHYFDTPNLSLRQQKVALRTRHTQSDGDIEHFEQTIKTPGTVIAGLHQRPEYNVDLKDDNPILALFPEEIWQVGTDINLLQQQVIELFSTNFTRHTWLITLADTQIELAFDSGEIACKGYKHKPKIYEIELELVSGDTNVLFSLSKMLFSQLPLRPGQLTKAARGYALFRDSTAKAHETKEKSLNNKVAIEQTSLTMISLGKHNSLEKAFREGVSFLLTQLQFNVDSYVEMPSLNRLSEISALLASLRQGFWLFGEILSEDELKIRSELSYFIRTIHWVDNARYIQDLNHKQSSYQKETSISQTLISKLQLTQKRYPSEMQVIKLLHSERFNNLQLSLLSLLLNSESPIENKRKVMTSLEVFAARHLTENIDALNNELSKLEKSVHNSSTEIYLTANSLLIRLLLTTGWFSALFVASDNMIAKKFNMPWIDIKQGISELQYLNLLQQQLVHLPNPEKKLASWLIDKSENLITALDQSRAKALSMKPYWPQ